MGAEHPTILVVDDDDDARYLIQTFLETQGFCVVEASDAHMALQLVNDTHPDVVLMDLMMPGIDGIQCCQVLHDRLADNCPPVLMVTGLDDEASINRAFAAQATDFITKPVNLTVLKNRIHRILRERELVKNLETANSKLKSVSQTDGLTKIANRLHFQNTFSKEWARLTREQQPLGLLLCDLDAFKQYNDTYGHVAGDVCLQKFAAILQASIHRTTDLVARYGGEEFILLLPNTGTDGVKTVDARIRHHMAEKALVHQGSWVDQVVTYSAGGIVTVPYTDLDPQKMIELADRALYNAKTKGRNQTIVVSRHLSLS